MTGPACDHPGMNARNTMNAVAAKTGDIGAAFYFTPETTGRGKDLGLGGFYFYFIGRGGVLGDVEPAVIHSAFGYFHPEMVAKMWSGALEKLAPQGLSARDAAREYIACAHAHGRAHLSGIAGLDAYAAAARKVIDAIDDSGLALFAGVKAEPVPDDAPAAAFHEAMVLRELRGSVHLVAVAAAGLRSVTAHAIKRPNDVATFGWAEGSVPAPSAADIAARDRAESMTDDILESAFAVLSGAEAEALIAGTDAMHAALYPNGR
jgi:hypothetical protein